MKTQFRRLWLGAALAMAGLVMLAGTDDAQAQKTKKTQPTSNAQLEQAMQVLHSARITLEAADHDYGGHRAAAVKAIGAAHHQLRLALGLPKGTGKGAKVTGNNEAQALSDMQLAATIPVLNTTIGVLNMANSDYGGHRADAIRDLGEAVTQLQKALVYIKTKEKKGG